MPSHLKLMKEFITLRDKVDAQIQANAAHDPNDKLLAGIALTPAQKSMKFDKRRVPEDKAQQICVFCNHRSTNEGENNDKCEDNNRKKAATRAAKMKVWEPYARAREEWEKSGGNGPEPERPLDPHTKNPMMRKPKKLTNLDSPELQCMCLNSSCAQAGSDTGSTCFVLCRVIGEQQEVGEDHPRPLPVQSASIIQSKRMGLVPNVHAQSASASVARGTKSRTFRRLHPRRLRMHIYVHNNNHNRRGRQKQQTS